MPEPAPETKAAFPEPDDERDSDEAYRVRLRVWFDSIPDDHKGGPGFRRGEWEYITSLAGVSPD